MSVLKNVSMINSYENSVFFSISTLYVNIHFIISIHIVVVIADTIVIIIIITSSNSLF